MVDLEDVYPVLRFFVYVHLPTSLQRVSQGFHNLAWATAGENPTYNAETDVALRKLLEAKDAAVRSAL